MSSQLLIKTPRSPFEVPSTERRSFFRRIFGGGQRRRRTYLPVTPDQY